MLTKRLFAKVRYSTFAFVGVLLLSLILASLSPDVAYAGSEWDVKYWNNTSLSGESILQRTESELNHDWGDGTPADGIDKDSFSARWQRTISVPAGVYRFTATMDDGMRLWVDDVLIIDSWWDSQVHSTSADFYLGDGEHRLKVEYYEAGGKAVAKLHWAQVSNTPGAIYNWRGEYYNNIWLSGTPVLVRDDQNIDFDWGGGAPEWGIVAADQFSARWTRDVYLNAGRYRFVVTADDGARLWVNGHLLIDQWHDGQAAFYSVEMDLPGGSIPIKMEYYENNGGAVAKLAWLRLSDATSNHWRGEYFNNRWLSGSPLLVRDDGAIDFNWAYGSPAAGIHTDNFSVRWTRDFYFTAGTYRFTTTSDDGVRLWVNGHLLIDKWQNQVTSSHSNDIYLSGNVPVKMEYYEDSSLATARLSWARLGDNPPPSPPTPTPPTPVYGTVVVDDSSSSFVQGGSATAWHTAGGGHDGQLTWTRNNDRVRANYNWARWYPSLNAQRYEVFVYIPGQYATTENARYWVSHQGGYTLRVVDQAVNDDGWVSLGTYWFRGSSRDYVSLSDVTFEPYLSHLVAYDAMKWEPR